MFKPHISAHPASPLCLGMPWCCSGTQEGCWVAPVPRGDAEQHQYSSPWQIPQATSFLSFFKILVHLVFNPHVSTHPSSPLPGYTTVPQGFHVGCFGGMSCPWHRVPVMLEQALCLGGGSLGNFGVFRYRLGCLAPPGADRHTPGSIFSHSCV